MGGSAGTGDHAGGGAGLAGTAAGGSGAAGTGGGNSGATGGGGAAATCTSFDDGSMATTAASLQPFSTPADPGAGGILFDASGEVLAFAGYPFPPTSLDDPAFVDGWNIQFDELLVTIANITISNGPDTDPMDPSKTGNAVAQVAGPFAIDLHPMGPLLGKGGGDETAIPIAALSSQNMNGDEPFDPTTKYAFGFDTVAATSSAMNVNLSGQALKDYGEMIANGYVVFYVGTATFAADPAKCTTTDGSYDFTQIPTTVRFRLGFKSPTSYVNCQNPDLQGSGDNPNEEHPRGIQVDANKSVIAQITIHTDHPFWESVVHDSPAHFDQLASRFAGCSGVPTVNTEMLKGIDFTSFRDGTGRKLPWRDCASAYASGYYALPTDAGKTMHFDPQNVPIDPSSADGSKLRDYLDYFTYNQSTQGHLNSDGLCYVRRHYPSPP